MKTKLIKKGAKNMKKLSKFLVTALALCLCMGFVFSAAACSGGNPLDKGNDGENIAQIVDGEGNVLDGTTVHNLPAKMTFVAPMGQSVANPAGVTVTATVLPETATNKKVDWSVAWVSTSGGTISEYVTVTPSADGSTVATVKCLKPFSNQIKIVVTSRENASIKAECVLDYLSSHNADFNLKYKDPTVRNYDAAQLYPYSGSEGESFLTLPVLPVWKRLGNPSPGQAGSDFAGYYGTTSLQFNFTTSAGTLQSVGSTNLTVQPSMQFINLLATLLNVQITDFDHVEYDSDAGENVVREYVISDIRNQEITFADIMSPLFGDDYYAAWSQHHITEASYNAFLFELQYYDGHDFLFKYEVMDNDESSVIFDTFLAVSLDQSSSTRYAVSQITLDTGSLVFG